MGAPLIPRIASRNIVRQNAALMSIPSHAPTATLPDMLTSTLLLANDDTNSFVSTLQAFQDSHAFLISILIAIVSRLIIAELRNRIERPVVDEVTRKTREQLTPDTEQLDPAAWAKLALCIGLDLAGDASECVHLSDFAPAESSPHPACI